MIGNVLTRDQVYPVDHLAVAAIDHLSDDFAGLQRGLHRRRNIQYFPDRRGLAGIAGNHGITRSLQSDLVPASILHTDLRHLVIFPNQFQRFCMCKSVVQHRIGVRPHKWTIQHHGHQLHAIALSGRYQTTPGFRCVACLDSITAPVLPKQFVFTYNFFDRLVNPIIFRLRSTDNFFKIGQRISISGDLRQIICRRVVAIIRQPMRIHKIRMLRPDLLCFFCHHISKSMHRTGNMLRHGNCCIISGLHHHPGQQLFHANLVPFAEA